MISHTDKQIVNDMVANNIGFVTSVPCKQLADVFAEPEARNNLLHVPCNKEDEGMGLFASAYMGGKRSAIVMQNTTLASKRKTIIIRKCTSGNANVPVIERNPVVIIDRFMRGGSVIQTKKS